MQKNNIKMFNPCNDAITSQCSAMWIGRKVTALMWLYPWPLTKPQFCIWRISRPSSPRLSWSGHAAASQCPAAWFSELSFPGTVWPWPRVNQALLGTTSWECRVKREEVLLNMDWWSVLRQNGVTFGWKQPETNLKLVGRTPTLNQRWNHFEVDGLIALTPAGKTELWQNGISSLQSEVEEMVGTSFHGLWLIYSGP